MAEIAEYIARAAAAIEEVLNNEYAVVKQELQARISEREFADSSNNIDPHHVTSAIKHLEQTGRLIRHNGAAKGGKQTITTLQPADQRKRVTRIESAAARKRLLFARYNGWAATSVRHPHGIIGPAGEAATRHALIASGGLLPATPGAGPVSELLGTPLTGSADSGGLIVPLIDNLPGRPITVIIEVKNIRDWIYPSTIELYQVLDKAAALQLAHPDQPILPILVCRRAHLTTFWMAQQLGFTVIDMGIQYVGNVPNQELLEVRNELHFNDLHAGSGPSLRVRDRFQKTLPRYAPQVAQTWGKTCAAPSLPSLFRQLRYVTGQQFRQPLMQELRERAPNELSIRGGW